MSAFGDFTVTRASSKRVLGSAGTLVTYANNEPAFEFNTDGTYRGLSVEPGATNQIRNNSGQGAVAGTPGTLPTNWDEALNGLTRQIVGVGTESGVDYVDIRFHGTATGGSVSVRTDSATQISALTGQTWTSSAWLRVVAQPTPPLSYRLSIIERTLAGGFVTSGDSSALSVTSSLARFSFTRTLSGGATVERVQQSIGAFLTSGQSYDFTIRIGFPQMETGAVATSVIRTTGSTANRSADEVTLTGASSLIGQTEGVVYAEIVARNFNSATSHRRVIAISDGTTNNRIAIANVLSENYRLQGVVVTSGSTVAQIQQSANNTQDAVLKTAIAYKLDDIDFYVNGSSIGTDTSATIPACSRIDIGNQLGSEQFINGWIRSVALYKTRLSNAQLQALTTL